MSWEKGYSSHLSSSCLLAAHRQPHVGPQSLQENTAPPDVWHRAHDLGTPQRAHLPWPRGQIPMDTPPRRSFRRLPLLPFCPLTPVIPAASRMKNLLCMYQALQEYSPEENLVGIQGL